MSKHYIVNCYTCQHNGQETCKGCNTLLVGESEPYENWQLREDLETKDHRIAELEEQLKNAIVPKFKIGQIVWFIDTRENDFNENEYMLTSFKIETIKFGKFDICYEDYWGDVLVERDLFATKEEARAKLEELKGNNYVY